MKHDNSDRAGGPQYGQTVDVAAINGILGEENAIRRNFRDYAIILRERVWYVVIVFLIVFLATLVYTMSLTRRFTAIASIEVLAREAVVMKVEEVRSADLRGPEDLNTQVKILESGAIVMQVAERLTAEEKRALMAPYETGKGGDPLLPGEVLGLNRKIMPIRMTRILQIAFSHPDGEVAAKMANYFVEEFMNYNSRWRVDESLKAVEELKIRADQQSKKVQELGNNLQAYREREGMVSLDQRRDIVTERLRMVSSLLTQANSRLAEAELRWRQVQEMREKKGELTDLTFIGSSPLVQSLTQQVATNKIGVAQLEQRYRSKHPKMQEALQSLAQTDAEFKRAVENSAASVQNDFETARRSFEDAKVQMVAQETESLKMGRLSVDYGTMENELRVNEGLLATIVARMRETSMSASIESRNARMVDRAARPTIPSSPNVTLNLCLGAVSGLVLGLALAFLIAFIDDRVKGAYQIESLIGVPLLGVVPNVPKLGMPERAQLAVTNANPLASEAFRTLHASLRLKFAPKESQVILVTSTTPGEGKSFITSNLALTFAENGEKTVLVDCDLRKPTVHRSFGISNRKGVIDYCIGGDGLDDCIIKGHRNNFDILTAGERSVIPTQVFNHESFAQLIVELRKRYDRIIIDTPPLAPVSDALLVLRHVDGSLFTVRFNKVRTSGAKLSAKRLLESNVPCFGAVLNGLNFAVSDYYYAGHYGRSFREYLIDTENAVRT